MKKIILSIATVLMMGIGAFANSHDEISKLTINAFNKDFSAARNISWEKKQDFVKVTFTLNDQVMFAYYDNNGVLKAVVRNLASEQLPINLYTELKSGYADYWISDLFEVASDDQTTYFVTLENADRKIVLTSISGNSWSVYAKSKKNVE